MVRSSEQWAEIMAEKTPEELARQVLGDLTHYHHGRQFEDDDRRQIINLVEAARRGALTDT